MKARTKQTLQKLAGDTAMISANTTGSAAIAMIASGNTVVQAAVFFGAFYGAMRLENRVYRKMAVKEELRNAFREFKYERGQYDF